MSLRPLRLAHLTVAGLAIAAGLSCGSGVTREGTTIRVAAGGNLQAALDQAQPGDTIALDAGATYKGSFTLPAKTGNAYITIQSSSVSALPEGQRVGRASAASMPKIVASREGQSALRTAPGAHHYRLVGLDVSTAPGVMVYELVSLGTGEQSTTTAVPHDIVIDRCYIHGLADAPLKRGVGLNSAETTIQNSLIDEVKAPGQDSQAIGGWNGPGPFHILNNELSAAGENIMFGGANPAISKLVPSDIEIRGNHLYKPREWKDGRWSVKNLFELKSARRVIVDGNRFEYNWAAAQSGFAIVYNCVDDSGWARVEDVQFTNNVVSHAGSGVNISGSNPGIGCEMSNLVFRNNVFADINSQAWGGDGRLFQVLNGPSGVVFDHNFGEQTGAMMMLDGRKGQRIAVTNNITMHGSYGVTGSDAGIGTSALTRFFETWQFEKNAIIGLPNDVPAAQYPANNFFPATRAAAGLIEATSGLPALVPSSRFRGAGTDGRDIGVDIEALRKALR